MKIKGLKGNTGINRKEQKVMKQKYCTECGSKLEEKLLENEGMVPFCPKCKAFRFPMYNVAVSIIVVNESTKEILLIQQYGRPVYILVAGYVNRGEKPEEAVIRELLEETGMRAEGIRFNRTSFYEPSNTLMCNFTAYVKDDNDMKPNEEIDSYHWFPIDEARKEIKQGSLAAEFLNAYLEEIQNLF